MGKAKALTALGLAGLLAALAAGPAEGAEFLLSPEATAVGAVGRYVTREEDTLPDLARRFDLGYTQLLAANRGVDPWLPGTRPIILPSFYLLPDAPRQGIVVNLAAERLFYYPPGGRTVVTFPIGIAVQGWTTPLGVTRVVAKQAGPTWYPPPSIHAQHPDLPQSIPPGPNNPLGAFALFLGWPGYLIHGTNKPDSVGRLVSHGCFHLYPEDIAWLYRAVPLGTPVRVVDEPIEVQWVGDALYAEVDPTPDQAAALESGEAPPAAAPADLEGRVLAAVGNGSAEIDWSVVDRAGRERNGLPVRVASRLAPGRLETEQEAQLEP